MCLWRHRRALHLVRWAVARHEGGENNVAILNVASPCPLPKGAARIDEARIPASNPFETANWPKMSRILITSGPTRQYIDPVRYISNASSGRMGAALAAAALAAGHQVVIVTGPVNIRYPAAATTVGVETTEEMLAAAQTEFEHCDGIIGVAAPCDYRPRTVSPKKISKGGEMLSLELVETPDVVATLGKAKGDRWVVGFALDTDDEHFRAITKLQQKNCDLIVLNSPTAIAADATEVRLMDQAGNIVLHVTGTKDEAARELMGEIDCRFTSAGRK